MERFDVAVIGAGAAGLFCAGIAGQRGLKVLLLDHAAVIGEKIRISGGGRCNFTNLNGADHERYLSSDPPFARHALRAYPPARFVDLVRAHRIGHHEKHLGQLFCDDASRRIIDLLKAECGAGRVTIRHPVRVTGIERHPDSDRQRYTLLSDQGPVLAHNLVIATGGLSIPALGATAFAWDQAMQWGLATVPPRPGLVPLTFAAAQWQPFAGLAGVSLPAAVRAAVRAPQAAVPGSRRGRPEAGATASRRRRPGVSFHEDLLFTHRGLSGPAILQISSYWHPGRPLAIDLLPGLDIEQRLIGLKDGTQAVEGGEGHRQQLNTVLGNVLPRRLAQVWLAAARPDGLEGLTGQERLAETSDAKLRLLARALTHWQVEPAGSEGYRKAEVTVGGLSTRELDPRTLQALRVPGLHVIGEAVDVTGWLGGYNFQWAWASAYAAAMSMAAAPGRDAPVRQPGALADS